MVWNEMLPFHVPKKEFSDHHTGYDLSLKHRDITLEYGLKESCKTLLIAGMLSGSAFLLANRYSRVLANSVAVNGKLAVAICPPHLPQKNRFLYSLVKLPGYL